MRPTHSASCDTPDFDLRYSRRNLSPSPANNWLPVVMLFMLTISFLAAFGNAAAQSVLPRVAENQVYWSELMIERAGLDGSGREVINANPPDFPSFLNVDSTNGDLYFAVLPVFNFDPLGVFKSRLDGTNVGFISGSTGLVGAIQIDLPRGHIYYGTVGDPATSPALGQLRRMNDDGTGDTLIIQATESLASIGLDIDAGKIYWSEVSAFSLPYAILRANLDGTSIETIFEGTTEALAPITFDPEEGRLYWVDNFTIVRANADGTGIEAIGVAAQSTVLDIDTVNRKLYYSPDFLLRSQRGGIHSIARANLDGTEQEIVIDGLPLVRTLAVDARPDLCHSFPKILDQFAPFAQAYDIYEDFDGDLLPEIASLKLIEAASCFYDDPLARAMGRAYDFNMDSIINEPNVEALGDFREVVAALLLVSDDLQDLTLARLADMGAVLNGQYVTVSCDGADICIAARLAGAGDPLSGPGDLDGDGFTNATEYANIIAQGGTLDDFVLAAITPTLNGTEPLPSADSSGGCFIATAAYGTPLADDINALRRFRDAAMLNNPLGTAFADAYYRLSPPIADEVAASPLFARFVRGALSPVLWMSKLWMGHRPWVIALLLFAAFGAGLRLNRRRVAAK